MSPKRLFLATYHEAEHFDESARYGILGISENNSTTDAKFMKLRRGDLVLVCGRASPHGIAFRLCGYVVGDPLRQGANSHLRDLLWSKEKQLQQVCYPLRVAVDFAGGPRVGREEVTMAELCSIGAIGEGGQPLDSPAKWGPKLNGNFITDFQTITALTGLLNLAL